MKTTHSDFVSHLEAVKPDQANGRLVVTVNSAECWAVLNDTRSRTVLGVTDRMQTRILPLKQILCTLQGEQFVFYCGLNNRMFNLKQRIRSVTFMNQV